MRVRTRQPITDENANSNKNNTDANKRSPCAQTAADISQSPAKTKPRQRRLMTLTLTPKRPCRCPVLTVLMALHRLLRRKRKGLASGSALTTSDEEMPRENETTAMNERTTRQNHSARGHAEMQKCSKHSNRKTQQEQRHILSTKIEGVPGRARGFTVTSAAGKCKASPYDRAIRMKPNSKRIGKNRTGPHTQGCEQNGL